MKLFDVYKNLRFSPILKIHNEVQIKKVERFDVYKKLRFFSLLMQNREKFKFITARSSRTAWCVFS